MASHSLFHGKTLVTRKLKVEVEDSLKNEQGFLKKNKNLVLESRHFGSTNTRVVMANMSLHSINFAQLYVKRLAWRIMNDETCKNLRKIPRKSKNLELCPQD